MNRENKIDLVEKLLRYHFEGHNATLMMDWYYVANKILFMLEAFNKTELHDNEMEICEKIADTLKCEK
jgi:hypothetical protein